MAGVLLLGLASSPSVLSLSAEKPAQDTIAVIYANADEGAENFVPIVQGIADSSAVRIYRIALNGEAAAGHSPAPRRPEPLKLAALANETASIAVLFPDIGEPYRSVFAKIIEGIEGGAKARVVSYPVSANKSPAEISEELRRREIKVVIALGRQGIKAASGLERDIGIVASGVLSAPETDARNMTVHSLTPDPALLVGRLKTFAPTVRRIHVVYDPRQSGWLIQMAKDSVRAQGLELVAYEAADLKAAVHHYQSILAAADPRRDAVWLPQDTTAVDESVILPMVLRESWNRNLTVFSSSVAHVRRGALFALYPNNVELGRNLAHSALQYLSSGASPRKGGLAPLREVLVAVNLRTAAHLGLDLEADAQAFDLVFPEP